MTEIIKLDNLSPGTLPTGWKTGDKENGHRSLLAILAEDIWFGKLNNENKYLNQKARGAIVERPSKNGASFNQKSVQPQRAVIL